MPEAWQVDEIDGQKHKGKQEGRSLQSPSLILAYFKSKHEEYLKETVKKMEQEEEQQCTVRYTTLLLSNYHLPASHRQQRKLLGIGVSGVDYHFSYGSEVKLRMFTPSQTVLH